VEWSAHTSAVKPSKTIIFEGFMYVTWSVTLREEYRLQRI